MRRSMLLVSFTCALGCMSPLSSQIVLRSGELSIRELERVYPLVSGANIRVDLLERMSAASVHLVQVRGGETPHEHQWHDVVVSLLRGEGDLTVGETRQTLRRGDIAVVPRGTVHWFVNRGREPALALAVFAPPLDAPDSVPVTGVDSAEAPR